MLKIVFIFFSFLLTAEGLTQKHFIEFSIINENNEQNDLKTLQANFLSEKINVSGLLQKKEVSFPPQPLFSFDFGLTLSRSFWVGGGLFYYSNEGRNYFSDGVNEIETEFDLSKYGINSFMQINDIFSMWKFGITYKARLSFYKTIIDIDRHYLIDQVSDELSTSYSSFGWEINPEIRLTVTFMTDLVVFGNCGYSYGLSSNGRNDKGLELKIDNKKKFSPTWNGWKFGGGINYWF